MFRVTFMSWNFQRLSQIVNSLEKKVNSKIKSLATKNAKTCQRQIKMHTYTYIHMHTCVCLIMCKRFNANELQWRKQSNQNSDNNNNFSENSFSSSHFRFVPIFMCPLLYSIAHIFTANQKLLIRPVYLET